MNRRSNNHPLPEVRDSDPCQRPRLSVSGAGTGLLATVCLLAGTVPGQVGGFWGEAERLGSDQYALEPVEGPPFGRLRWLGFGDLAPLPLSPKAIAVDLFRLDPRTIAVQTGGIDGEPLTYRFVDPQTGAIERVPSLPGALRLPPDFVGVPGSRPLPVAPGVFVLAWDAGNALNYRIRTFGQLLGGSGRDVPLTASRVESAFDADRRTIEIRFLDRAGEVVDEALVLHPDRGRAEVFPADGLDFGTVPVGLTQQRSLVVRNTGGTPLRGVLRAEGPGFLLAAPAAEAEQILELRLRAGGFAVVPVRLQPEAALGPLRGELVYEPQVPSSGFRVAMTGEAVASLSVAEAEGVVAEAVGSSTTDLRLAEAPRARDVVFTWTRPGIAEIRGRLAAGRERTVEVLVSGRPAGRLRLDKGGVFRFVALAKVGDEIALSWPDDPRSGVLLEVPHGVWENPEGLVLLARPGESLRIVERLEVEPGREVDLRFFIVRADAAGRVRIDPRGDLDLERFVVRRRAQSGQWVDVPITRASRSNR